MENPNFEVPPIPPVPRGVKNNRALQVSLNPAMDPTSPYFIHPSETPGPLISFPLLTGKNYHAWCCAMTQALDAKNKLHFVDGRINKPDPDSTLLSAWHRCKTFVLSWISHSLCDEIKECVMWKNVASEVWKELKEKYYEGDLFRIAQPQEDLFTLK